MLDVMCFWLDKGVDGFRVDAIWLMMKDEQFRDNPPNPDLVGGRPHDSQLHIYTANLPEVHDIIRDMRRVLDDYDERMMVGEIYLPNEELVKFYGADLDECHLPFNFQLILTPWDARAVRQVVDAYEAVLPEGAWPNWVLGNHDQHRMVSRVGAAQARVAQVLLLTLRGTPTCYYGDEIGMHDVEIPVEFIQDPPALNQPEIADVVGRDPERTPMEWDDSPNAGFTSAGVTPWLPVAEDYLQRNVAAQENDMTAPLHLFRALTLLCRREPAPFAGSYASVDTGEAQVFAYLRELPDTGRFLIVLNFGDGHYPLDLSAVDSAATDMVRMWPVALDALELRPNEGLVLRLPEC